MGFGFGLLRCWMLDSGWVEMVSRRRIFFYVVALHTHREDDPYRSVQISLSCKFGRVWGFCGFWARPS